MVPPPAPPQRSRIRIRQMDCPTEEKLLRRALEGRPDVRGLEFDLMARILSVAHAPGALPALEGVIRDLGMTPEPLDAPPPPAQGWPWGLLAGGLAALAAEAAHAAGLPWWASALPALAAVAASGLGTYRKGWAALRHGQANINALMSVAVTGALALGQWPEAAMVMVLFALAERIEARSLDRARDAVQGLLRLTPATAEVLDAGGAWVERDAATVKRGARVRVGPGAAIPLDGVVRSGRASVDQAPITGESLPVDKAEGDPVYAGTLNRTGSFEFEVTAEAGATTLARIGRAIEGALAQRAPSQRFVDRFAQVYTPAVLLVALGVALAPPLVAGGAWSVWLYRALVLLVIACPCALVISTPVTLVSGLAAATRHGILVKGGAYLEQGRDLAWVAFDKTGTLTRGEPAVQAFETLGPLPEAAARRVATGLASRSDHPMSRALAAWGGEAAAVEGFEALPGLGIRGRVDGVVYSLGNHRLIEHMGVCTAEVEARLDGHECQGRTTLLLTDGRAVLALAAVADQVREGAAEAVADLHALGLRTLLLTGDNGHTAAAIAAQVGIDEAQGDLLPEAKAEAVKARRERGLTAMVGDGINDGPALAAADLGFAMGAAGSDTALATADVALMDDDLRKLGRFVRLSRATGAVLRQNLVLAVGIKAAFLALTLLGRGTMWMAVFADMGASLLVVANGLRLLRK